jgi:dinuclear metal center YbgI/SA1388 family protein
MYRIAEIIKTLQTLAPLALQEGYDNAGLLTGNPNMPLTRALITLDCTEAVVAEAINKGCNLIIAHHPIVFKGLKKLNGSNYVERTIIAAIKNDIAIYAIHTNLDNIFGGVSFKMATLLGLKEVQVLQPKKNLLQKLTVFVPLQHTDMVLAALNQAGAGQIGNYADCSFTVTGQGRFKPETNAEPFIGRPGQLEEVSENRIEVIFPFYLGQAIIQAMREAHPYQEIAYYLQNLENEWQQAGSGAIGELPELQNETDFLKTIKTTFNAGCVKYTALRGKEIKKVALCGGSGSFLLPDALKAGADIFITSDFKYHEFFDAEGRIIIADIGHFESEQFTIDLLFDNLSKKFPNIAVRSEIETNPVKYL